MINEDDACQMLFNQVEQLEPICTRLKRQTGPIIRFLYVLEIIHAVEKSSAGRVTFPRENDALSK
jgi:hypothetical protein